MALGKSLYKIDAPGKVTGQTLYPSDIHLENALFGKLLFTGQPHARLKKLDITKAQALPGVVMVLTAADIPVNEHGLVMLDQPVMVGLGSAKANSDVSLWEGDRLALVLAETREIAEQAIQLIEAEWEQLPRLTDARTAIKDELLLHPHTGTNIIKHFRARKGDMAEGWAKAAVVVESDYYVPMQEHAYLQPEAGWGYIDEEGRVTVVIAGQWIHEDQHLIAHALNLPPEKVRVIYPAIGGAFGGREDMSLQIVLGLSALKLSEQGINRPVHMVWSREESIIGHHKRHQMYIHTKWGATPEGEITAVETTLISDAGSYNCTSNKVLGNAHLTVSGPYKIPHAEVDCYAVYTNNCPAGAFRGFGAPQGAFVAESQMNKLAAALNIDPVEIRLKNILGEGDASITHTSLPAGISLEKVIRACAEKAGWGHPSTTPPPALRSFNSLPTDLAVIQRGRGFACGFKNIGYSFGFPERCEATIELYGHTEVEKVVVYHAGADVGQGAHTAFLQMAAAAVGVPFEKVEGVFSDTATSGDSGSASASRLTWMAGNAIRGAAEKAWQAWHNEERPARGHFRYTPPATELLTEDTGRGQPNFTYGYVAQVVDLAIDTETGHIVVERVVSTHDVGQAINPNLIEGQVEGAIVQAHGYAITEHLQLKNGHILNPRLSSYLIPGIQDVPLQVDTVLVEEPDPLGPWGARGMAEMPYITYAPAVNSALHEATGLWMDELPLVPDKVLKKLKNAGKE